MKKKFLLIAGALIFSVGNTIGQSPDFLWTNGIGDTLSDYGSCIAVDGNGNVFTAGIFRGTVDFDPGAGTFNLTSDTVGYNDIFISKSDSNGNFIWAKQIGGPGGDECFSITLDAFGNFYMTGLFSRTVDFDPDTGVFNLTSLALNGDIFILKLSNAGNFVWAKAMGGIQNSIGISVAVDPLGGDGVYTTGTFGSGTVDFDPGAGQYNLTATAGKYIFISKLDSSGNFVWAKAVGGTGGFDEGRSIAIDPSGSKDVYTTGYFLGMADFNPDTGIADTFNLTSAGNNDIFISRSDSSGNLIWAKQIGSSDNDQGRSLAIDASGNIYTTGFFTGTVDFDPGIGQFYLTAAGSNEIFISKLDRSGNFIWAKVLSGTGNDAGSSLALDASANIYTVGYFEGTVDFDPGAGIFNLTSAGSGDIFISKLDSSGNFIWAKTAGGTNWDNGQAIAMGPSGNVHVTGSFLSPSISFGTSTLTNASANNNSYDLFFAKLDTTISTGDYELKSVSRDIFLFPNPANNHLTIELDNSNKSNIISKDYNLEVTISDIAGKIIYSNTLKEKYSLELDPKIFSNGIYFVRIKNSGFARMKKLIIAK